MAERRTWALVGHVLFVSVCLALATALGMAAAIGCGYGGSGCVRSGIMVALVSAMVFVTIGYTVRFLVGFVLARIYAPDRSGQKRH